MFRKIILVLAAVFCLTVSNTSAMAVYSGITDTVENVIQVLAKESERSVMYQIKVHTESNAAESMQSYTESNAERL